MPRPEAGGVLGRGPGTTAPGMPCHRRSRCGSAEQHAGTRSPPPPPKCHFRPCLAWMQPHFLELQASPQPRAHHSSAACEEHPACPQGHQLPRGDAKSTAQRQQGWGRGPMGAAPSTGPPAAEGWGPPPAACHDARHRPATATRHGKPPAGPQRRDGDGSCHVPPHREPVPSLGTRGTAGPPRPASTAAGSANTRRRERRRHQEALARHGARGETLAVGGKRRERAKRQHPRQGCCPTRSRCCPVPSSPHRGTRSSFGVPGRAGQTLHPPKTPGRGSERLPRDPKRLTGAGRWWWAGGLLAPRPGCGSQARSELPRADARCLCERARILRIPGSRPEIPQSYILHIWFQLGSGEGEPVTNPGWLFGGGYFPRPEGMCAKL